MLVELTLTHACGETYHWSAGAYFDRWGRRISQCAQCRERLGEPFVRAEEGRVPVPCRRKRPARAIPLRPARAHLKAS